MTTRRTARAWIQLQRNWWAHAEVHDTAEKSPRKAWRLLQEIADLSITKDLVEILGTGPLEDFIRCHGPRFIRRIEQRAATDSRFAQALRIVYLPKASDPVSKRFFALGCRPIKAQREPWQTL